MMHKFQHHFLQFAFRHLAVADDDSSARYQALKLGGDFPDGVHAVVDEVHLAAPVEFLLESGLNQLVIPACDDGLDCDAIFGWGFDYAHVTQSDQRHVQCAWDGSCGHGEHVYLLAHLLDAFFVANAKTLLFVDDKQSQISELYIF